MLLPHSEKTNQAQNIGQTDQNHGNTTKGWRQGNGSQHGGKQNPGSHKNHGSAGSGANISGLESGNLTNLQRTALANMAEEEKMAHDLYVALGDKYPNVRQFQMIPNAESQHLQAVQSLLARYSITDPTVSNRAGEFTNQRFQTLYDTLLSQGLKSQSEAMKVGVTVEKTDIADLEDAGKTVTAPDVVAVYENLTAGSERHLAAFSR